MLCALPLPPSRWHHLYNRNWSYIISFSQSNVGRLSACTEMDVHLHVWCSWKVTATKVSVSSPTTRAERVLSLWVNSLWFGLALCDPLWPYISLEKNDGVEKCLRLNPSFAGFSIFIYWSQPVWSLLCPQESNPYACLVFYWEPLNRQVIIQLYAYSVLCN